MANHLTLIPWKAGRPITWDVTVASTSAAFYVDQTSRSASTAAELASVKYANLEQSHIFQPLAFENFGSMIEYCYVFISNFGHKMSSVSGDHLDGRFLKNDFRSQSSASVPFSFDEQD